MRGPATSQRREGKNAMRMRAVLCETVRVGLFLCGSACANQPTSPSTIHSQPPPSPQSPHRTISGLVREVNGSALGDVTIRAWSRTSRDGPVPIGSTAADGSFHFEQLAQDSFSFTKSGYEIAGWSMPQNAEPNETFTIVVKMEPTLLLTDARPIQSLITPDDLAYSSQGEEDSTDLEWPGNVLCGPCKAIFVSGSQREVLTLSSGGGPPLTMGGRLLLGSDSGSDGRPDEHELVVEIPADRSWNTGLVGLDRRHDPPFR